MIAFGYCLPLLFSSTGGPGLPGNLFRLGTPHQAYAETPFPEVHTTGDLRSDILGPAVAQRLCKDDMGEEERSLEVPTPAKDPPPFHRQYVNEAVPHYT